MRRKEASLALPLTIALFFLFWFLLSFHVRHFHGQPVTAAVRAALDPEAFDAREAFVASVSAAVETGTRILEFREI